MAVTKNKYTVKMMKLSDNTSTIFRNASLATLLKAIEAEKTKEDIEKDSERKEAAKEVRLVKKLTAIKKKN